MTRGTEMQCGYGTLQTRSYHIYLFSNIQIPPNPLQRCSAASSISILDTSRYPRIATPSNHHQSPKSPLEPITPIIGMWSSRRTMRKRHTIANGSWTPWPLSCKSPQSTTTRRVIWARSSNTDGLRLSVLSWMLRRQCEQQHTPRMVSA